METTFVILLLLEECYLFHKKYHISNVKVFFIALALDLDGSCLLQCHVAAIYSSTKWTHSAAMRPERQHSHPLLFHQDS